MLKRPRPRTMLLFALAAAIAGSVLAPAAANAGGTYVTVEIRGAGAVNGHKMDCTSPPAGRVCPTVYYESDIFKDIDLHASAPDNWRFDRWLHGGSGQLNCASGTSESVCRFRSGICAFCTFKYSVVASFVRRDDDGDGSPRGIDCDDNDDRRYPGADEVPGNGVDENCDHQDAQLPVDFDKDDDGYERQLPGARPPFDCNDDNKDIWPGAAEIYDNAVDEDCNGKADANPDRDRDGYQRNEPGFEAPFDCDDQSSRVYPGAEDVPENGVDEDCRDGDAVNLDRDRDGYERPEHGATAPFDCDDDKAWIHPGAQDVLDNNVDEDCDGRDAVNLDRDRDGYERGEPGAKAPFDCDDAKAAINPGALDIPRNKVDENCDGRDAAHPSITSEVRYAAHRKGGKARIRRLAVIRPPDGATVTVLCRGKGCTFKRRRQVAAPGTSKLSFASEFRKAKLRRGAVVEVWITRSDMRGKVVRLKVGRGARVTAQALCVEPGSKKPGGCPVG